MTMNLDKLKQQIADIHKELNDNDLDIGTFFASTERHYSYNGDDDLTTVCELAQKLFLLQEEYIKKLEELLNQEVYLARVRFVK